jgi:hypothetical protein
MEFQRRREIEFLATRSRYCLKGSEDSIRRDEENHVYGVQ